MPIKKQRPKRDHWTCPICAETYYVVGKYASHMRVAHMDFKCPQCKRRFADERQMEAHQLVFHKPLS